MCLSNARQPYATIFVWLSGLTLIETICPKVCLKSRPKSAKSPLPVDVRISALVPQLSFAGKLVVASQIRLFSQTQSVQEKNAACITLIKLFRSYKVMGTLQSYDDGDGAKIKQLLCMHLHKLFCQFL